MKIGINPDEKILTIDNKQFEFREILLSKEKPIWIVKLKDGGALLLNFGESKGFILAGGR